MSTTVRGHVRLPSILSPGALPHVFTRTFR